MLGARPAELEALLERRRALGQDLYDEVWAGEYHMVPCAHPWHGFVQVALAEVLGPLARAAGLVGTGPFNLGAPDNYRVPDGGYHRAIPSEVWVAIAAIVVEVLSPDDETWQKLDFYATAGVDEVCVADPFEARLRWFVLTGGGYEETDHSALLSVTVAEIAAQIPWPTLP